jgi:hypothetical protein
MAKNKNNTQGSPVQGEPNSFAGFEGQCKSGKGKKAGK